MAAEVRVPQLGESVVEATVGRWLKSEGESISASEALVELETDKVNVEVPAGVAGVVQTIRKQEGDTVVVGDILALIGDAAGSGNGSTPPLTETDGTTLREAPPAPPESAAVPAGETLEDEDGGRRATPLARRIAEEHGVDLGRIQGTGPAGRVRREDVDAYLSAAGPRTEKSVPAAATASPSSDRSSTSPITAPSVEDTDRWEERVRMSRRRQTIAQRLVEAQHTAAMLSTFNEVDLTAVMEIRKRRRDAFRERHGVGLGYMSFFTRAVVGALKEFPRLNAEIQGNEMLLKHYYDIGIAVSTDEGLVVPVLRDADRMTFAAIEQAIAQLASKAKVGQLSLAELQGGTFTITNGGTFGSLLSTPILNTPQVGILGMHKIQERPVAVGAEVVIRPMMYVALSYDHRIVDGSEAVRFLVRVKEMLEDPETLLLEG